MGTTNGACCRKSLEDSKFKEVSLSKSLVSEEPDSIVEEFMTRRNSLGENKALKGVQQRANLKFEVTVAEPVQSSVSKEIRPQNSTNADIEAWNSGTKTTGTKQFSSSSESIPRGGVSLISSRSMSQQEKASKQLTAQTKTSTNTRNPDANDTNDRPKYRKKLPDGSIYEGELSSAGLPHGKGLFIAASGDRFEGDWENGKIQGRCLMKTASGDTYNGSWSNNLREGYGIEKLSNGDIYQGQYENDKKNGLGRIS